MQFTSTEFRKECQTCEVCLTLTAPEHQEMNGKVEVTWKTLLTVPHYLIVHAIVLEVVNIPTIPVARTRAPLVW